MNYEIILYVFFISCCAVCGQAPCETAIDGGRGYCKSIFKCQTLLSIVNKNKKTTQDKSLLKSSHCGIDDNAPAVCCPVPKTPPTCNTPEGKSGQCISLYSCPNILNLLTPPTSKEKLQFVGKSKCNGNDQYSVCCGPVPNFNSVVKGNCSLTAFPPDPRSGCCGVDSRFNLNVPTSTSQATTVYQYPWLALIQYDRFSVLHWQASGVLISGTYVLTAARVVAHATRTRGIPVNIRLGEYNTNKDGPDCVVAEGGNNECTDGATTIPIEKTIPHPNYNSKENTNDIALIRMIQTARFTDFIRPICLPTADVTRRNGDFKLTVAGWGTSGLWPIISNVKLHTDVPYLNLNQCQDLYSQDKVTPGTSHLCIGRVESEDSCKGDNALMYKNDMIYECVGIVSFGALPCQHVLPVVYTNVYLYTSWIRETIVA